MKVCVVVCVLPLLLVAACDQRPDYTQVQAGEERSGGDTTLTKLNPDVNLSRHAYSQPAVNLPVVQRTQFAVGNSFFTLPWVSAPASVNAREGLGPFFNAAACQDCHIRDGRGHPPDENGAISSLLRLSMPGREGGDAVYGSQIQNRALPGIRPEAEVALQWQRREVTLAGGETVSLRRPLPGVRHLAYGELEPGVQIGLRVAPAMIGLGLLELIPESAIVAGEDIEDRDGDGISGRANRDADGRLGRFGWKASQPSVRQQSLVAFSQDIGITSAAFPAPVCPAAMADCLAAADGEAVPELDEQVADAVVFYARHLAVPARRWHDTEEVLAGKALFHDLGCAACHRPHWKTKVSTTSPALSAQSIWPYTDMLLHDMGPDLADGIEESLASGREWRTAPLWGIHLAKAVGGAGVGFLHDGRARNFKEAILWHGGEAEVARQRWAALPRSEREQLIWFLKSL